MQALTTVQYDINLNSRCLFMDRLQKDFRTQLYLYSNLNKYINRLMFLFYFFFVLTFNTQVQYENFDEWSELCNIGQLQSPIDLIHSQAISSCDYNKFVLGFLDGYTEIEVEQQIDLKIRYRNSMVSIVDYDRQFMEYLAEDISFHHPSQHTIDGQSFDLEMQLKHHIFQGQPNSLTAAFSYCSVSLLFSINDNSTNNIIDQLIPSTLYNQSRVNFSDIFTTLLAQGKYYHYHGSHTTPSCSQNMNWYIYQTILPIRTQQLELLKANINSGSDNNRPIQPTNSRPIYLIDTNCNSLMSFEAIGMQKGQLHILFLTLLLIITLIAC